MCTSHVSRDPLRKGLWSRVVVLPAFLCVLALANCGGDSAGLFPGPLSDLDLGGSSSDILTKIGDIGTVTTTPLPMAGRQKITWNVPVSPYFKRMEFEFTEKDRMFLLRLVVKDEVRLDVKTIKQKLFDKFKVSWDEPNRFSRKDADWLVYGPEIEGKYVVFEVTDTSKGGKSLEVFSTSISQTDRAPASDGAKKKEESGSGKQEPAAEGTEKTSETQQADIVKDGPKPEPKIQGSADPATGTGK